MAYTIDPNMQEELDKITLDKVTPYTPPAPAQHTPQFTPAPVPPAAPYEAPDIYTPAPEATVEGRMKGLLEGESPYMQAARGRGMLTAQQRGLLNTSMAAEAAEKAAIESAFPIASQDAASFLKSGLLGYQGQITGALAGQEHLHKAAMVGIQAGASAQLSAQDATQKASTVAYEAAVQAGLSSQAATQEAALASYQTALQSGLSEQEARQVAALSSQEAIQRRKLEIKIQAGATYRQKQELAMQQGLARMELGSQEKTALGNRLSSAGDEFMVQLTNIQRDPEISSEAKAGVMKTLQDAYQSNLTTLGAVYGAKISWKPLALPNVQEGVDRTKALEKQVRALEENLSGSKRGVGRKPIPPEFVKSPMRGGIGMW